MVFATVALAAAAVEWNSAVARSGLRASSPTLTALVRSVTSAQELARTAQTTAETYATDHYGSYAGLTLVKAERIEPSLRRSTNAKLVSIVGHASSYRLATRALLTRQTFSIAMGPSGKVKRRCTVGLGCPTGVW
jgi:hypothetical protein